MARDFLKFLKADKNAKEAVGQYPPAIANAFLDGDWIETPGSYPDFLSEDYVQLFNEWMANNVAHYIMHDTVANVSMASKGFFAKVAKQLRSFYTELFNSKYTFHKGFNFPDSIKDFMEHVAKSHVETVKNCLLYTSPSPRDS